jgi:hypothetical protein
VRLSAAHDRIHELFSFFVTQIKGATAAGLYDKNKLSETVLIPLFGEIFGFAHLKNLNASQAADFPAIDLADDTAKVAIQVTATASGEKVRATLGGFLNHGLHHTYRRLIVYVLSEKQKSYSVKSDDISKGGTFRFDPRTDILDYRDLLKAIASFQIDKVERIRHLLEANFGDPRTLSALGAARPDVARTEQIHLNALKVSFPKTLYIAELIPQEPNEDTDDMPSAGRKRRKPKPREQSRNALAKLGLKFAVDWELHGNSLITFHDLEDPELPLSRLIDLGTVTSLSPEEFYGIDINQERVFKSLLRRCLQQKFYHRGVGWQEREALFFFLEENGLDKRIERWEGEKWSERTVFERTRKNTNPEETLYCKHLAFSVQFKLLNGDWLLAIKPEWFFSWDGYKPSYYGADKIDWLKRKENNMHVYNHFRFISYYLTHTEPSDLFRQPKAYPYLTFGDVASFDAPFLDDEGWKPAGEDASDLDDRDSTIGQEELFDL